MPQLTTIIMLALAATAAAGIAAATQVAPAAQAGTAQAPASPDKKDVAAALNFTMKDIDGKDVALSKYQGKVVLIVNVASECGLTPQYADLQALHDKYAEQGLVILGFPANEFNQQEPGSNEDIKTFCTTKYNVKFPMFAKVVVKGEGQCDLYKFLTSSDTNPKFAGEIQWNFTKFLLARDGRVVNRFEPKVKPSADEVIKAIEAELAKQAA
jgi:glutathione peroxidase